MSHTGDPPAQIPLGLESGRSFGDVFEIEEVSPSEGEELTAERAERTFLCRRCDGGRLRTRRTEQDEGSEPSGATYWRFRALRALPSNGVAMHVSRALLESRIVARSLRGQSGGASTLEALRELPYPEVEPGFAAQLTALRRRREASDGGPSVDWAIERVVAELYECSLPELVRLQTAYPPHSSS